MKSPEVPLPKSVWPAQLAACRCNLSLYAEVDCWHVIGDLPNSLMVLSELRQVSIDMLLEITKFLQRDLPYNCDSFSKVYSPPNAKPESEGSDSGFPFEQLVVTTNPVTQGL